LLTLKMIFMEDVSTMMLLLSLSPPPLFLPLHELLKDVLVCTRQKYQTRASPVSRMKQTPTGKLMRREKGKKGTRQPDKEEERQVEDEVFRQ